MGTDPPKTFARLALATTIATYLLILVGALATWLVIAGGSDTNDGNANPHVWSTFRQTLKWGLGLMWLGFVGRRRNRI